MRLLIDMDEVLCDWSGRILQMFNWDRGSSFTREDISSWEFDRVLPNSRDFIDGCMRQPGFYEDLEPIPGAVDGMRSLVEGGHDVVIATRVPKRATSAYGGKVRWIREHMPFFDIDNLIVLKRKELIDGDVLFDDSLDNIRNFVRGRLRQGVLMARPWNASAVRLQHPSNWWKEDMNAADMAQVTRLSTWPEFLTLVRTWYTPFAP
jgi:5'(3')-deoxyribonucleotidase